MRHQNGFLCFTEWKHLCENNPKAFLCYILIIFIHLFINDIIICLLSLLSCVSQSQTDRFYREHAPFLEGFLQQQMQYLVFMMSKNWTQFQVVLLHSSMRTSDSRLSLPESFVKWGQQDTLVMEAELFLGSFIECLNIFSHALVSAGCLWMRRPEIQQHLVIWLFAGNGEQQLKVSEACVNTLTPITSGAGKYPITSLPHLNCYRLSRRWRRGIYSRYWHRWHGLGFGFIQFSCVELRNEVSDLMNQEHSGACAMKPPPTVRRCFSSRHTPEEFFYVKDIIIFYCALGLGHVMKILLVNPHCVSVCLLRGRRRSASADGLTTDKQKHQH